MPALYVLGQHPAPAPSARGRDPSYLDDIFTILVSLNVPGPHYWMHSPQLRGPTLGQGVGQGHQPSKASQSWLGTQLVAGALRRVRVKHDDLLRSA